MLLQVEKYIGHGKTTSWFINPDHIISIGPGQNNHSVAVLTTDLKIIEVAGKLEELVMAFNTAKK
jgi:hypothetical protein